jgi:sensor c-di-GMP phosphodiesterase-like protein
MMMPFRHGFRGYLPALTRRNVLAALTGLALAGIPLVGFNLWLGHLVENQARFEVETAARRAAALADTRLGEAVALLDDLAGRGIDGCGGGTIETLRQAVFQTPPVKQLAVLSPDGRMLCADGEISVDLGPVASTHVIPGRPTLRLEVLHPPGGGAMVRLRRPQADHADSLAALLPLSLLLPQIGADGTPLRGHAAILAPDGAPIGAAGPTPADPSDSVSVRLRSAKLGMQILVAAPRAMLPALHSNLRWLGTLVSGLVALIFMASLVAVRRSRSGDPVAALAAALKAGEFVPYYQPVVDIRSGQLRGAEVLVRWRKPDGSLELPGSFIPLAESSGLIRDLTRHLMRRVCAEAGEALGHRPALKISFNFAARLFSDPSIVKDVRKIFANSPLEMQQVVLELTERDPIENFAETRQVIAALQAMGVRIAIDDVGTGHSGLSYMLKLGVDIIKIDKMFVDAIGTDRNSTTIVETLVDLAHNMRMDVVAEGVENFEQVMHLREVGIRSAQGYVFAPPLPGSAFLQLVEAIDPLPASKAVAA